MKLDQEKGVFVEDEAVPITVGDGDLIIASADVDISPTFILMHDKKPLVKVWVDTGKVEVMREPEDEAIRMASEVFWESIEHLGGTLCRRVRALNELLTEVRRMVPGPDVMSGLRAFSGEDKEKLASRIDELLDSNRTFLEEANRRSILVHGEGEEHQEGGQGKG